MESRRAIGTVPLFRTQRWQDEIFTVLLGVLEWVQGRWLRRELFSALKRIHYFAPGIAGSASTAQCNGLSITMGCSGL
jgi:hypothetical protein